MAKDGEKIMCFMKKLFYGDKMLFYGEKNKVFMATKANVFNGEKIRCFMAKK